MSDGNGVRVHEMTPQRLLELVGSRREIARLFTRRRGRRREGISQQAISKWFKAERIPPGRIIQLAHLKPEWFR